MTYYEMMTYVVMAMSLSPLLLFPLLLDLRNRLDRWEDRRRAEKADLVDRVREAGGRGPY